MIRPALLLWVALILAACGADEPVSWVDQQHARNVANFGDDPDILVQRGLLADRKHRYVDLLAHASGADETTGLDVILAGLDSDSTNYLARAEVTASEVRDALRFIGVSPGHPIDVDSLKYWPKGERLSVSFYSDKRGVGRLDHVVKAERLVVDKDWNAELPQLGFRFVGPGNSTPAATEIVTSYNAMNTLLEVSYTVDHNTVLKRLRANPAYRFAADQQLMIRLRPEYPSTRQRVQDYLLEVATGDGLDGNALANLKTSLRPENSEDVVSGGFEDTFVYLEERIADGEEPFVRFRFAAAMSAASVRGVALFASQFLVDQQIRIEPSDMEPYISAFLPNDAWRDPSRRGRATQPLEIHLHDDGVAGELFQYVEARAIERHAFANVAELDAILKSDGPWQTDGVFLFVAPDTPYNNIRSIYALVSEQYGNFYVFL